MRVEFVKAHERSRCCSRDCRQLPAFILDGLIKINTYCASITMENLLGSNTYVYCEDCSDTIYHDVVMILGLMPELENY